MNWLKKLIAEEPKFNYDMVRPLHRRNLGPGIQFPPFHATYVPYSTVLRGLSIDATTGIPQIPGTQRPLTHWDQLPRTGAKPEAIIEVRFAKEMVKVGTITFKYLTNDDIGKLTWLISGEIDNNVIWRFIPKELRGEEFDSRSKQFYAEVKSVKDNFARILCDEDSVASSYLLDHSG